MFLTLSVVVDSSQVNEGAEEVSKALVGGNNPLEGEAQVAVLEENCVSAGVAFDQIGCTTFEWVRRILDIRGLVLL